MYCVLHIIICLFRIYLNERDVGTITTYCSKLYSLIRTIDIAKRKTKTKSISK